MLFGEFPPRVAVRRIKRFHQFSLDAPVTAVTWWLLLDEAFPAGPAHSPAVPATLGLVVWAIYLWDRAIEPPLEPGAVLEIPDRKRFARDHRGVVVGLAAAVLVGAAGAAASLPSSIWLQGGIIGLFTVGYFFLFRRLDGAGVLPYKETLIGGCFAAGVGLPYSAPDWREVAVLIVFGGLCTGNCLLISLAERDYDRRTDRTAWFVRRERRSGLGGYWIAAMMAVALLPFIGTPALIWVPLAAAVAGLWGIEKNLARLGEGVPAMADAALWLPAAAGLIIAHAVR